MEGIDSQAVQSPPPGRPRVLVTRPRERSAGLCRLLREHGATPLRLPAMALGPANDVSLLKQAFSEFSDFTWVIFVSATAAEGLARYWPRGRRWPSATATIAVGSATAVAVREAGFPAPLVPTGGHDSEGVLAMPELQAIKGRGVLIVRGNGGRETLAERLRARGATVRYAETYARIPLSKLPEGFRLLGRLGRIDVISTTSNQTLDSILCHLPADDREWVLRLPLVVSAQRQMEHARGSGFTGPIRVAADSSDEAMLEAILDRSTRNTREARHA